MINERTAGDDVHMQVEDRLPRGSAGIDDRTVSGVISQQLMGDARHGEQQTGRQRLVFRLEMVERGDVLARDDQDMHRRNRVDILDDEQLFIRV